MKLYQAENKFSLKYLTAILIAGSIALPCFAEKEIPVHIKSDVLRYSEGQSIVTATGSVEITIEDVKIYSDKLVMDTRTKVVTAEGNILMKSDDFDATGTFLTYQVTDEITSFKGFSTKMAPSTIKGNLYVTAGEILKGGKRWDGKEGDMTTCDYVTDHGQHYDVAAKYVEYYPDEKVVGYSVTFYIGRVPILWAPYMVYDLKKKRKRNWTFGHNEVEGDFIKTFWDYPSGVIMLDLMERKGWGKGFDHTYDLKKYGSGTLYLYEIDEPTKVTDWVYKLNHSLKITPQSTLTLGHQYYSIYQVPGGRIEQTSYKLDFSHQQDDRRLSSALNLMNDRAGNLDRLNYTLGNTYKNINTNYYMNLDQSRDEFRSIRSTQRLTHSQNLFNDQTNFNFFTNYSNNIQKAGQPGDETLETNYTLTTRGSFYSLSLYENWYNDLDRGLYTGDEGVQYLEKMPEVTLSINPYDLKLFKLTPSFGYGFYREVKYVSLLGRNRDFSASKYTASLSADQTFNLWGGNSFNFSYGVNQYLYDPGDQLYNLREMLALTSSPHPGVRNNINFNRSITEGNTPFFFDTLGTRYSNIRDTLNFQYYSFWNWMLTGGYNYDTKKHFNIDSSMSFTPHPAFGCNFRVSYDIENKNWLDLISNARYSPAPFLNDNVSLTNDLNTGQVRSLSNVLDLEILDEAHWGNHWKMKLGHVYNTTTKEFKLVDVMLVKDLHCWEIKYTYSDYRKEFGLTFTLKALPSEPFGYTPGRGFYFDSFEKALQEEFSGGTSPQRY